MLTKFRLINTAGLKGLFYKGDFIPFEKIDDKLAEQLIGKTHVLERIPEGQATAPVAEVPAAEAPVAELPAAPAEAGPAEAEAPAPTTSRRRSSASS